MEVAQVSALEEAEYIETDEGFETLLEEQLLQSFVSQEEESSSESSDSESEDDIFSGVEDSCTVEDSDDDEKPDPPECLPADADIETTPSTKEESNDEEEKEEDVKDVEYDESVVVPLETDENETDNSEPVVVLEKRTEKVTATTAAAQFDARDDGDAPPKSSLTTENVLASEKIDTAVLRQLAATLRQGSTSFESDGKSLPLFEGSVCQDLLVGDDDQEEIEIQNVKPTKKLVVNKNNTPNQVANKPPGPPPRSPQDSNKKGKTSPRVSIAKVFSQKFRKSRRRSSSSRLDSMPEDSMHTDKPFGAVHKQHKSDSANSNGPIPFVAVANNQDDEVSQITYFTQDFRQPDTSKRKWRGTKQQEEGLSWVPAAGEDEGVIHSAQSIHDLVKSRQLETSSGDESDPFDDLSDPFDDLTDEGGEDPTAEEEEGREHANKKTSAMPETKAQRRKQASELLLRRRKPSEQQAQMAQLQKSLQLQILQHGNEHPEVARTLTTIALRSSQAGERDDGPIKLLLEVLTICKSIGDQDEIARAYHNLGDVHCQRQEFKAALEYYLEALNVERKLHGYCHSQIADTLNTIGTVHANCGEYDVAVSNHQHALQILKDCVSQNVSHPLVARTLICIGDVYYKERNSLSTIRAKNSGTVIEAGMLNNVACAHEARGSYRMAVAFFDEKLQLLRSKAGSADPRQVAETLVKLGNASVKAGDYHDAMSYYEEAFRIQSTLKRDQVKVAEARLLTGTVHFYLGRYRESLDLLRQALSILQVTMGKEHDALVAETLLRIGMVRTELGEYDEAMNSLKQALKIQKSRLGDDNPGTSQTRLAIGNVMMNGAKFDLAIEQFTSILEIQNRLHGPKHPHLAETMYCIARAYEGKGDVATATKFFEESFFIAKEFLGNDHPAQASTLHGIADLQAKKGRHKKALVLLANVLSIRKETLGEDHMTVALTLCSVASCHAALGRFVESQKFLDQALSIAEAAVGPAHPSVAQIHVGRASLCLRQCQFAEARVMAEKGLKIFRQCNIPCDHPQRMEAERILEHVERDEMLLV